MGERVLLVRHGNDPTDDRIVTWLGRAGLETDSQKPFVGDPQGERGMGYMARLSGRAA
ncbi:hypothetical protein [Ruegeria arenilitoris]|uniref:hypothetical protein n=1 Tax=Ruegeria arenilitoris TaxID=1173585 RepID=UPI00147CEB31|nr:hypothetical protein [Ruegeria arenilitoris]